MRSKTSPDDEEPTLLGRVYERGEETLGQLLDDLFGRRGVVGQVRDTAQRASEARRRLDRNMQFLLKMLNVPSRADYDKLVARVDTLQGSLVNVSMKLDRLLALQGTRPTPRPHVPPAPKRRAAKPRRTARRRRRAGEDEGA